MCGKRLALTLLALLIGLVCSACGGDVIVEPTWYIGLEGAEKPIFTSVDYAEMDKVSFEGESGTWLGVYMKDALEYSGIKEYASVTLVDRGGHATNCPKSAIDASGVFLATERDKERLRDDSGALCAWVVMADGTEIKAVKRIIVNQ